MPKQQAGLSQVNAAEMVQFCMVVPMAAEPLDWNSTELAALAAYVESIQPDYRPMGVPGTNGFVAENLIIISTLETHTGAGIAALIGIVLGAAYFLSIYQNAFLGPIRNDVVAEAMDLRKRELVIAIIFIVLIMLGGIFPSIILDITLSSSEAWISLLGK